MIPFFSLHTYFPTFIKNENRKNGMGLVGSYSSCCVCSAIRNRRVGHLGRHGRMDGLCKKQTDKDEENQYRARELCGLQELCEEMQARCAGSGADSGRASCGGESARTVQGLRALCGDLSVSSFATDRKRGVKTPDGHRIFFHTLRMAECIFSKRFYLANA